MERKVPVPFFETSEIMIVEYLLFGASSIPEAHLTRGLLRLEKVRKMSAQWRHAGAAANIDHFALRGLDMEVAERSNGCYDVAGLEAKKIAGTNTRSAVLARRRCGDTYIESQQTFPTGITSHRIIVTPAIGGIMSDQVEDVLVLRREL